MTFALHVPLNATMSDCGYSGRCAAVATPAGVPGPPHLALKDLMIYCRLTNS